MRSLVIYDSLYGNTEKIALAIAKKLKCKAVKADKIDVSNISHFDLMVVGSPTHGGQPTLPIQQFLDKIPTRILKNKKVAVFDTRLLESDLNFALKLLVKTIGYAAPKIAKKMAEKEAKIITSPRGFIVKGKEGPLASEELVNTVKWTEGILKSM